VDCWRYYRDGFSALARWARLQLLEVSTEWEPAAYGDGSEAWKDTVMVCAKPRLPIAASLRRRATDLVLLTALRDAVKRHRGAAPTPAPEGAAPAAPARGPHLEDQLDARLRDVLAVMQRRILTQTTYFGVKALRSPIDAWVYQELVHETRPDVIVEIGNASGGGTLALAHLCDLLGRGKVIGLDLSHDHVPAHVKAHPRITFIDGDACDNFERVAALVRPDDRVLVIEDSSHTYENTLRVLRTFSRLTKPGDYFIVEDGISRHGVDDGPSPGPYEAIAAFVAEDPSFEIDRGKESFLVTWNPTGYLRRRVHG
jgi:cephalosporin hydroxylase